MSQSKIATLRVQGHHIQASERRHSALCLIVAETAVKTDIISLLFCEAV